MYFNNVKRGFFANLNMHKPPDTAVFVEITSKTMLTVLKESHIMKLYPLTIASTRLNVHTAVSNIFTGRRAFAQVVTGGFITTAAKGYIFTKAAAPILIRIMQGFVRCAGVGRILVVWGF